MEAKAKPEFCPNFKVEVSDNVDGDNDVYIRIYNNRGTNVYSNWCNVEKYKLFSKNKVVITSAKVRDLLYKVCKINLQPAYFINRAIGGIYIEYFSEKFWITNFKGFRQEIKLGKLLKALTELNDVRISNIIDKVRLIHESPLTDKIEIVEDIVNVYDMTHIYAGTLGYSCMRYHGEYYERLREVTTPEQLSIAILKDEDNKLLGRALIWQPDNADKKLMDRIYFTNAKVNIAFKKYAERNDMYYRNDSYSYFYKGSKELIAKFSVTLSGTLEGYAVPYMDSFRYYSSNGNSLFMGDSLLYGGYDYKLTSSNGSGTGYSDCSCSCCGDSIASEECNYDVDGEPLCDRCIENYYVWCVDIAEYVHRDSEMFYAEDTEEWHYRDSDLIYLNSEGIYVTEYCDLYYMEDTNEYYRYLPDEAVMTEDNGYFLMDNCAGEVNGCWYYYEERYEDALKEFNEREK